jgi:hypothetical protein
MKVGKVSIEKKLHLLVDFLYFELLKIKKLVTVSRNLFFKVECFFYRILIFNAKLIKCVNNHK